MRVGEAIAEPLRLNTSLDRGCHRQAGGRSPARCWPGPGNGTELSCTSSSGGHGSALQVARAIILRPALIVLDEPVSALDVSVRLQVVNLLVEAQKRLGMSYLLISHDLATKALPGQRYRRHG